MKRLELLLLFMLSVIAHANAADNKESESKSEEKRYVISGAVIDSARLKSISYATIALIPDTTKMAVASVASDTNGKFSITAKQGGDYILSVAYTGYTTKNIKVELDLDRRVDVGDIYLSEGVDVDEVVVTYVKPLITSTADKIAYNLESDPEAATSTALEIMRKVPMLSVDGEDNVKLNGESSYKVLVNGRTSTMMSKNFNDVIKSMPANSIKSIEVITNPPTKYDAEGLAGIINIITNKQAIDGFNGTVNVGANQDGGYNGGGYVAIQRGKFALSANGSMGHTVSKGGETLSSATYFDSDDYHSSTTTGSREAYSNYGNFSVEASYEIDTLNLITISARGYIGRSNATNLTESEYLNIDGDISRLFSNQGTSGGDYGGMFAAINYQKSFAKPDKSFTVSYNYGNSPASSDFTSSIIGEVDYSSSQTISINTSYQQEHTVQIDYFDPVSEKHQWEMGGKYILRTNYSDGDVNEREDDSQQWQPSLDNVNNLDYNQHVASLYGGYVFKHEKLTARAGFRAEMAINDGVSISEDEVYSFNSDPLFNIVPYANISMKMDGGQSVNVSYTQRLNRPGIWYLNPYVNDYDPMNIYYGNPDLETVVSNSMSMGYRKNGQRWNLFLNGTIYLTDNAIERVTTSNADGVTETTYQNIGHSNSYRINGSFSYRKPKYNIYVNASLSYIDMWSTASSLANSGFAYSSSVGASVKLWKDANININGYYSSPSVSLQGEGSQYYNYSFGLTQKFLKQKLTLSVYASNPFNKSRTYSYTTYDDSFTRYFENVNNSFRQFRFSASYRFGKNAANVKKARRTINNDDVMSGGGQGGE
ncbi:MAG: outer membrane beta-barrel protein [Rikenellaceae bacterium]